MQEQYNKIYCNRAKRINQIYSNMKINLVLLLLHQQVNLLLDNIIYTEYTHV